VQPHIIELIDEDLDVVAGGSYDVNIADIDINQYIAQAQVAVAVATQAAANVASVILG
jgi:hypothetical protein